MHFVKYDDTVSFYDAVSDTIRRRGGDRGILSSCSYYLEDFDYRSILVNSGTIVQWSKVVSEAIFPTN